MPTNLLPVITRTEGFEVRVFDDTGLRILSLGYVTRVEADAAHAAIHEALSTTVFCLIGR